MSDKLISYFKKFYFLAPIVLYLGERSLIAYDEGIYALQAKWIIENNNWITPMKWGAIVDDRTIGIQFLIAICQKILGEKIFAIYIPSIFFGLLMIFLTYELHKELTKKPFAIISPIILSTTYLWINYFHMATQDIIFASLITLGIFSSVKSCKSKNNSYLFLSGAWIGLAVMMKTYLTIIPLIAILPFLWKTKIIRTIYFWIGSFLGFLPFLIWSIQIIIINGWETYSGLYKKLLFLSEQNVFTNPIYYYLWNFMLNSLPWSIFIIFGFLQISKSKDKLANYFLLKYPIFILFLLSLFSSKTPYYPLQIVSLTSINAFLGINYILSKKEMISRFFFKFLFFVIPIFLLSLVLYLNINKSIFEIEKNYFIFINIIIIISSISLFCVRFAKTIKAKFILILIGPYLLTSISVQSGLLNDRSKGIRIEAQNIIKDQNLSSKKVEIITRGLKDEYATKKIIKLAIFMPKLGNGISNIQDLEINQYAWIALPDGESIDKDKFKILHNSKNLYPWKLVKKIY